MIIKQSRNVRRIRPRSEKHSNCNNNNKKLGITDANII